MLHTYLFYIGTRCSGKKLGINSSRWKWQIARGNCWWWYSPLQ